MLLKKWGLPIAIAFILNAVIISVIPSLVRQIPEKGETEYQSFIDVVRLRKPKPPETPPERQKPPEPEEEPPKATEAPITTPTAPQITQKIDLRLETNIDIPSIREAINLPVFTSLSLPVIKAEYSLEDLDRPLSARVQVPPLYPLSARRRGVTGWVDVRYLVNLEGYVEDIEIIEASPEGVFENSVMRSVSSWRFNPGNVDGVTVKTRIKQRIEFTLDETN